MGFPWQGACRRLERQATVEVVRRWCNLPAVLPHSASAQRRRPALRRAGELICQSCVLLADNSQPPTNSTHYAKLCRQNGECIGTVDSVTSVHRRVIAVHNYVARPLLELTCHMGSHGVTCHPAEVTFPPSS